MNNQRLMYLITKAFENLRDLRSGGIKSKIIFVVGASGSGKTSFSNSLMTAKREEGGNSIILEEIGGILRETALTNSKIFEVHFEISNLFLEISAMASVLSNHYRDKSCVIIDGGIIQSYAHLLNRKINVDEKLRRSLARIYDNFLVEIFARLPKTTVFLLEHKYRSKENVSFEEAMQECLTYTECYSRKIRKSGNINLRKVKSSRVSAMLNNLSLFSSDKLFCDNQDI